MDRIRRPTGHAPGQFLTALFPVYTVCTFPTHRSEGRTGSAPAPGKQMRSMKHSPGFTLVELLITLVVAAILLAWGVPSFQRFMDRTTLTSETNQWVGMINTARSEAITRSQRVSICRTTDPDCDGTGTCPCGGAASFHDGVLIFTSDPGTPSPTQFDSSQHTLLAAHSSFSDKVVILANDAADAGGAGTLTFQGDGTLDDANDGTPSARFVICPLKVAGDATTVFNTAAITGRFVEVNATGRPRVDELTPGNCNATAADSL